MYIVAAMPFKEGSTKEHRKLLKNESCSNDVEVLTADVVHETEILSSKSFMKDCYRVLVHFPSRLWRGNQFRLRESILHLVAILFEGKFLSGTKAAFLQVHHSQEAFMSGKPTGICWPCQLVKISIFTAKVQR